MQVTRFQDGSAVIHGMTSAHSKANRISAWFNPQGKLYDAEGWYGRYNYKAIARNSKAWPEIARRGSIILSHEAHNG